MIIKMKFNKEGKMYNNEALTAEDRAKMLEVIGVEFVEDLYASIPREAMMKSLDLPEGTDEIEAQKNLKKISKMNKIDYLCFLGSGAKKRFVPSIIADIASRFEFLSCYTPYQAEISQGSLRVMYEFQSVICSLVNQDVSNASVYDGASACAEAILMASRLTKRRKAFISEDINPNYLEVIKTYLYGANIELIVAKDSNDEDLACKLYQSPNYFGEIVQPPKKTGKELIIASVNPSSLALFEPPKVDITVGDIQTLGLNLNFGGAWGGFIACKDEYKRQLAGRIAGKTLDKDGNTAYVLTLQAREQHIRREKATSNICSNQALCALCANLYLSLMGEKGFREVNLMSYKNAHKLALGLKNKGYKILNNTFFNEFVFELGEENSDDFISRMKKQGILAGIKLDDKKILCAATELNTDDEIEKYLSYV